MVSGLTSPDKSRYLKDVSSQISEIKDIVFYSTPSTNTQASNSGTGVGNGKFESPNIHGLFGFQPNIEFVGVRVSFTNGSGTALQEDTVTTDLGGSSWQGLFDSLISGTLENGEVFIKHNNSNSFDSTQSQTLSISGGWSGDYTVNSAIDDSIYASSSSIVVDSNAGDPTIRNILQNRYIDGQVLLLKPVKGKTLTLKSGGNIDTLTDVVIEDSSFVMLHIIKMPEQYQTWSLLSTYVVGDFVNFENILYQCISNTSLGESPSSSPAKWIQSAGKFSIISGGSSGGSSGNVKAPVKVATQFNYVNLALVGDNIDNITVVAGDRVLVKNQSNKADNGIYKVDSVIATVATLTRDVDMPDSSTAYGGTMVYVESGTNEGGSVQILFTNSTTASDSVLVGTDDQDWYTSSGGEVFTWSADHDANFNNLNNLEQLSFVDSANDQRGFIAGQTDAIRIQVSSGDKSISFREDPYATDVLYINRYGLNQGHATGGGAVNLPINPSAGFISIANDEYITWRNSANTNDALLRFNASDQMEFNFNSVSMLKIDQPNSLLDFEQNDLVRVNNINSYTGDHDIGNTDPFHRIFADRFIPVSENYATGTTGELRKNDFATYIDLQASGTFDIRRDGVGKDGLLTDGSDPWFRFDMGAGTSPEFKIYHNGSTDPKISLTGASGNDAEIYYSIANESLTIKNTVDDPINLKGVRFNVAGSDIASLVSTGFHPVTDDSHQLGTSTKRWSEVVSSGNVYGTSFVMNVGGQNNRITSGTSPSYTMEFKLNGGDAMKLSKEFTTDNVLEINGNPDPTYKLRSTKTSLTGQIGTVAFDAFDSAFVLPHTYAYISSEITDGTSTNKKGKLIFNVTSGNDPDIPYMELDGSAEETKFLKNIDMQNNQIRGVGSIDMDGVTSTIEGLTNLNFYHTGNQISSVTDLYYFSNTAHRFTISGSSVLDIESDRLDMLDHSIEFTERTDPSTPVANHGLLYSKDNGGTTSLYWLNSSGTPIELGGGGGSTSFIGFTADADLNMGTYDIYGVDRFTFATTEGAGDSLGAQDTGIDAIYASGLPFGMRINVPTNNSSVLQIARGGVDKYTLSALGHTFSDVVRFGSNYTVFNSRSAVSHTTPSQRYLFQDSSDNHLKIRTDSGLIDLEAPASVDTSASYVWTGQHTFTHSVTSINSSSIFLGDSTSDTITCTARFGADLIPRFDINYNLGNSTNAWSNVYARTLRLDTNGRYIQASGANDMIIEVPSTGIMSFRENGTTFWTLDGVNNVSVFYRDIELTSQEAIRANTSGQIGFFVTNTSATVGTEGSLQIPWLGTTSNTKSGADADFGGATACCGINEIGGTPVLLIRKSDGSWWGVALSSFFP